MTFLQWHHPVFLVNMHALHRTNRNWHECF